MDWVTGLLVAAWLASIAGAFAVGRWQGRVEEGLAKWCSWRVDHYNGEVVLKKDLGPELGVIVVPLRDAVTRQSILSGEREAKR
jgi:hypothetical protein